MIRLFFSTRGRIGRLTFWLAMIVPITINVFLHFEVVPFYKKSEFLQQIQTLSWPSIVLLGLVWPTTVWMLAALQAKRWQDRNKSAFWLFIFFVPFIGLPWWLIEVGFLRGTEGANEYGPPHPMLGVSTWDDPPSAPGHDIEFELLRMHEQANATPTAGSPPPSGPPSSRSPSRGGQFGRRRPPPGIG